MEASEAGSCRAPSTSTVRREGYTNSRAGVGRIDPLTWAMTSMSFAAVLGIDPVANQIYSSTGGTSVSVIDGNFEAGNVVNLPFMPSGFGPGLIRSAADCTGPIRSATPSRSWIARP
jgi:hypothetical protein